MRIALQTICFSDRLGRHDWADLLPAIKAAGYDGLEIFQNPSDLPEYPKLAELCRACGLQILGLTGGHLRRRMDYLRPQSKPTKLAGEPEPYLYIENWEDGCDEAERSSFRLALHYHHLSVLSTPQEARNLLKSHPRVLWLPDTAHLFIGEQRPEKLHQLIVNSQLVAKTASIHIKDWDPSFGRFSHRYARGFCMPGDGSIGLQGLLRQLQRNASTRNLWGVVELDYTEASPEDAMRQAAKTLNRWGVIARQPADGADVLRLEPYPPAARFPTERLLELAARGSENFLANLAEFLLAVTGAEECFICSVLTAAQAVTARVRRPLPQVDDRVTDAVLHMERTTAKTLAVKVVKMKQSLSEGDLLAVPVFNCFNPHAVRHVIVYRLPADKEIRVKCEDQVLARSVALAIDIRMAQRCQIIAERTALLAARHQNRAKMLNEIADLLKRELHCEGVTIFRARPMLEELEVGGSTGIAWDPELTEQNQEIYSFGSGITGSVAKSRSYLIYRHENDADRKKIASDAPRSWETGSKGSQVNGAKTDSVLAACYFDEKDAVAGVVRCRNPIAEDGHTVMFFSEDDLALVEAAMLAVQPELETFAEDLRAMAGYEVLMHELTSPIFFVRGAALSARRGISSFQVFESRKVLRYDYLDQVDGWLDLIGFQLESFKYFVQGKLLLINPAREPTYFFAEIVAPMVSQLRLALEQHGFAEKGIDYGNEDSWKKLPRLMIDRKLFNQVVYNLLNNSIKYACREPSRFKVRIWGEIVEGSAEIHFEDSGIGIAEKWKEVIFNRGGRIVEQGREQIQGYGLGLWLVHQIIERHGGTIQLTGFREPTRFTIRLPLNQSRVSLQEA